MNKELCERAERGATLLDEKYPGWALKIDVPKLDMRMPDRCILGQLYEKTDISQRGIAIYENGFAKGRIVLFNSAWNREPVELNGFDTSRAYTELTECWIEQITARISKEGSNVEARSN